MPYVFRADIICDRCRAKVDVPKPTYAEPFDNDDYPSYLEDAGECDSPFHCGDCGEPLDYSLTEQGVKYVLESVRESLEEATTHGRSGTWDRIMPAKGTGEESLTYWHGSRHVEIVRQWAEDVSNYNLEPDEKAIVDLFLELSAPVA